MGMRRLFVWPLLYKRGCSYENSILGGWAWRMSKKNAAIVLGSTKDFFYATGPVVLNIKKFSPDLADDIVIYYDDIAERDLIVVVEFLALGGKLIDHVQVLE